MTWGRMDDKFHRSRKVKTLRRTASGRKALGTWVFWWSWCLDDPELNGFIPSEDLDESDRKCASVLVSAGLWDEIQGGFCFHDFHDYNPTREQREAKLNSDRSRMAGKRGNSRTRLSDDSKESRFDVESTRVLPSHPIRSEEEGTSSGSTGTARMEASYVQANHDAIRAYQDGIQDATGKRIPIGHNGRYEQAAQLRALLAETFPESSESDHASIIRKAAALAAVDPSHKNAGTPFAWFARAIGTYVGRIEVAKPFDPNDAEIARLTAEYNAARAAEEESRNRGFAHKPQTIIHRDRADALARRITGLRVSK